MFYLIGGLLGKDQRTKDHKDTCSKEIGLHFQLIFKAISHSILNIVRRIFVFT